MAAAEAVSLGNTVAPSDLMQETREASNSYHVSESGAITPTTDEESEI